MLALLFIFSVFSAYHADKYKYTLFAENGNKLGVYSTVILYNMKILIAYNYSDTF